MKHIALGKKGEDKAVLHLTQTGYRILHRNWSSEKLEIDIIALKDDIVVFIEVKARSTSKYGWPEEAITKAKAKNLIEAAELYLEDQNLENEIRFDIISLVQQNSSFTLQHFIDAINPYDLDD